MQSALCLCVWVTLCGTSIFPSVKWGFVRLRLPWNEEMLYLLWGIAHQCWCLEPRLPSGPEELILPCSLTKPFLAWIGELGT